jgi:ABC-type arginine/histidine transport system permease subunit
MEENSIPQGSTTVEEGRMRKHIHVAAILQIVFGALNAIIGLAIAFAFGFVDQFVDDPTALKVLAIVGTPLIVMFLLFGGAMIAGGIGTYQSEHSRVSISSGFSCSRRRFLSLPKAALKVP